MTDSDFNLYTHFAVQFAARAESALLDTADGRRYRYRDIHALAGRMASGLTGLGVRPGDRVSVQVAKSPESLALYLACLRGGFVYHPLNTAYKSGELEYFLGNAEPAAVVGAPDRIEAMRSLVAAPDRVRFLSLDGDGAGSLSELAQAADPDFTTVPRAANDLAALLYSSGTTGQPKGIMLTHANLLSNTQALVDAWGFTAADRLLHALPIYHVHGLFVAIGCVLLSGASMRWLAAFNAREVLGFLPECTVMMGVPTFYTRLLAEPGLDRASTANVRLFVSGSAPLLTDTFTAFEARTGHRILERYGMTETNMNTSNPLVGERRPGTVGLPLPGVEVRVCDDAGRELPAGEIGGLQVRGPNVFCGYWRMPEKTAEDFTADGWFNTGDQAVQAADGYVSIVGRAKDMVITGGLNVYPKEVERVIDALPGVRESAVIGVPHPDFGEAVVAVVVAETDADGGSATGADVPDAGARIDEAAIIAHCRREIADFKVPKRALLVDALPRNAMAKVQKNVLRERYRELFA